MGIKKIIIKLFLLTSFVLLFAQCGGSGSGNSGKIEYSNIPETPIVINADTKFINGLGEIKDVTKPWFKFTFRLDNQSDLNLVIVAVLVKIADAGYGEYNAVIDPGELIGAGATTVVEVPANTAVSVPLIMYMGTLPNQGADNFFYNVEVEPLGWFGTYAEPVERFRGTYFFSTE